jgi:large subunit ribosomal protein L10
MAQTKAQKQKILEDLKEKMEKQKAIIFFDFTGLKVKDFSNLRRKIKAAGDELKVVKKTLMDIAFKKAKLEIEPKKMAGEIALAFGFKDAISLAKEIYEFSKVSQNLKILGGFFENQFRPAEEIIELAQLPSKEQLLARLVGSIASPMSGFISVLQGNIKGLIYALSAIKK